MPLFDFHTGDGLLNFQLRQLKVNIGVFAGKGLFGAFDFLFFFFFVNLIGQVRPFGKDVDAVAQDFGKSAQHGKFFFLAVFFIAQGTEIQLHDHGDMPRQHAQFPRGGGQHDGLHRQRVQELLLRGNQV